MIPFLQQHGAPLLVYLLAFGIGVWLWRAGAPPKPRKQWWDQGK
jgi:hypothetical protein